MKPITAANDDTSTFTFADDAAEFRSEWERNFTQLRRQEREIVRLMTPAPDPTGTFEITMDGLTQVE